MKNKAKEIDKLVLFAQTIAERINCVKVGKVDKINGKNVDIKIGKKIFAEVPIFYFGTSKDKGLFCEIEKGETGLLFFFDDNIDGFLNDSAESKEKHSHDLSDCIFVPGFFSNKNRPANSSYVVLKNSNTKLILRNGKASLGNASVELISTVIDIFEKISDILTKLTAGLNTGTTPAGGGAVSWTDATFISGLGTIKGQVETLKSNLEGLKI